MNNSLINNIDTLKLEEKLDILPPIFADALVYYYGLDGEEAMSMEEIMAKLNEDYYAKLDIAKTEQLIKDAVEMTDYHGDLAIKDSERVIMIHSPKAQDIKISLDMQKEYGCKSVFAVTIETEDKSHPEKGIIIVTLMALNEKGLRKINDIMGTGYRNDLGVYVRDYEEIIANKKDNYLVGITTGWRYFFGKRYLARDDEPKYEIEIRDKYKDADFCIMPTMSELYTETSPEVIIFSDESLDYSKEDIILAKSAAAVGAVYMEKHGCLPVGSLDTFTFDPQDVNEYIYLDEEGAMYAAALDPSYIADKAEAINIEV